MHQPKKFILSLLILLAIGLHALPLLQKLQDKTQTWWPFMAWGMYRNSYASSARTIIQTIGVASKGEAEEILSEHIGLSTSTFARSYLQPMRQGDASAARLLADLLNRSREDPIVEIRIESETYTITNSGIVKAANPAIVYRLVD
jgi:hypothetical protein